MDLQQFVLCIQHEFHRAKDPDDFESSFFMTLNQVVTYYETVLHFVQDRHRLYFSLYKCYTYCK